MTVNHSIIFKSLNQTENYGLTDVSAVFSVFQYARRQTGSNTLRIYNSHFVNNKNIDPQGKGGALYVKAVLYSSAKFKLYVSNTTYCGNAVGHAFMSSLRKLNIKILFLLMYMSNFTILLLLDIHR